MNAMKYSERVLVGFWFDQQKLEKEKRDNLKKQAERGELPHQKYFRLTRSFTTVVPLKSSSDFIKFGQQVQLHCPEIKDLSYLFVEAHGCPEESFDCNPCQYGLVLAATCSGLDAKGFKAISRITDGCGVACTPNREPAHRSVFTISGPCSCDERDGEWLALGQEFSLKLTHAKEPLYLRSETPLIDGIYGPRDHYPLRVQASRDGYAKFKALHWNRHVRFETDGKPIRPCSRIVIQHVMTGQCLAAENLTWHKSLLGFECGASIHTYSDVHRNETSECIWNMIADEKVYKARRK